MMKKVLALMLVLGMTSVASAGIVDVVILGEGSLGHAGTSTDPLEPSETIEIGIILNANPYAGYPSYDGYLLSSMDFDLHLSGPGTLAPGTTNKAGDPVWQYHANLSPFIVNDDGDVSNGLDQITSVALTPVDGSVDGMLMWDLIVHCDGFGPLTIDLTLNGLSEVADYKYAGTLDPYPDPPGWYALQESDLGDLVIHQIPEPMTIALLGLGGLFLRRRR
jgi:hypothetical protein